MYSQNGWTMTREYVEQRDGGYFIKDARVPWIRWFMLF